MFKRFAATMERVVPELRKVTSRLMVDVSTRRGKLMRNWFSFIEGQYLDLGWDLIGEPVQCNGRWVVFLIRASYSEVLPGKRFPVGRKA